MPFSYTDNWLLLTFAGMGLVTCIPRIVPIQVLSGKKLPESVTVWLSYVPAAVLSALLAPSLLLRDGTLALATDNLFLLAALPTFLAARITGSLFATVAVGMGTVAAARMFGL